MDTCPYCGLADPDQDHVQERHGISPEQHAALQRRARPAGVEHLEVTESGLTVPRSGHDGYI